MKNENEQLGYKKSDTELTGIVFILKDGSEMFVENKMNMKEFGRNLSSIPAIVVEYDDIINLMDNDIITDDKGHNLIYNYNSVSFRLFTDDPNTFISDKELRYNVWRKL